MSERTLEEQLEHAMKAARECREAEIRLVEDANVDLDEALRWARICGVSLIHYAETHPGGWTKELAAEATRREVHFEGRWTRAVDSSFRAILERGGGPVVAFDFGPGFVRSKVPPNLLAWADEWETAKGGALLCGPAAVGKTMALLALAWRMHLDANPLPEFSPCIDRAPRRPVVWAQALTLARERDTWRLGTDPPEFAQECERAEVLVLDDLLFGGHRTDVIMEIAAVRFNRGLPTLASTGFSEADVSAKLGVAVVRRLVQCGKADGVVLSLE